MADKPSLGPNAVYVPMSNELVGELSSKWSEPHHLRIEPIGPASVEIVAKRPTYTCPLCESECRTDRCKILCPNHGVLATCADPGF